MADFLIKNTEGWMNDLTEKEIDEYVKKYGEQFRDKHARRYRKGDILEVQEDNHWSDKATGNGKFRILRIPKLKKADALKYMESLEQDTGETDEDGQKIYKTRRRRAYNVDILNVFSTKTVETKSKLDDVKADVKKYSIDTDDSLKSDSLSTLEAEK